MGTAEHGPWAPLSLSEAVVLFDSAPFRWFVSGGHALELHLGRSWRDHDDTDISILRDDAAGVADLLDGWDIHLAAMGVLSPWDGAPLAAERSENNLWGRHAPDDPWCLDITISGGDDHHWIYRRDPAIQVAWSDAVLVAANGTPYLAPELQLLFKSKDIRPKDTLDATTVIPVLEPDRRARLATLLPAQHPWQTIIAEKRARLVAEQHLTDVAEFGLLAAGNSSQAWAASGHGRRWVVRVPIPNSGRLLSYHSEARIGEDLSAAGHPVCPWALVEVDETLCSIGPRLAGTPVTYGDVWTEAFAADLAAVLAELHHLPAAGFGPLNDDDVQLRGRSTTATEGIVDRWFRAAVWPFDQTPLEAHPIVSVAPDLAPPIASMENEIGNAAAAPFGVVHSDLHGQHLLTDDGRLSGVLDFGDAFVGSTAWDFALLNWYHGDDNTRRVAEAYPSGHDLLERGRVLALAVGCYKLAKNPDDRRVVDRLRAAVDTLTA